SDSLACVAIHGKDSDPTIRNCKIHDSKDTGVFVYERGRGVIEDCDLYGNRLSGVNIRQGSDPTVRNCKIHGSKEGGGVNSYEQGKGTIEGCDLFANKLSG